MSIPGHLVPLERDHCALCKQYHTDSRYRALVDGAGGVPDAVAPAPCLHEDGAVSGSEVARLQLDLRKVWLRCSMGHGEPAGVVCKCINCGPRCADFVSAEDIAIDF